MSCDLLSDPFLPDELCQPWQQQAQMAIQRGDLVRAIDIVFRNWAVPAQVCRESAFRIAQGIGDACRTRYQTDLLYSIARQRLSEVCSGERSEAELDDIGFLIQASMTPESQMAARALFLVTQPSPRSALRELLVFLKQFPVEDGDIQRDSTSIAKLVLLDVVDLSR